MNVASLPYSIFLLLAEFSLGGLLFLYAIHARGQVTGSFLKMGVALLAAGGTLTLWMSFVLAPARDLDGYTLAAQLLGPCRVALALLLALLLVYGFFVWREERRAALYTGGVASVAAVGVLALISAIVQQPTWSYAGTFLSLLAGGLALGGVTLAMTLGHWYLVTPRLPSEPLNDMTLGLLAILGVQLILLTISVLAPARQAPHALSIPIAQNPALWLRISVGLLFPILLCFMAWQSSRMRAMMSATGLLYIATGAILAGQALASALLFTTAIPS